MALKLVEPGKRRNKFWLAYGKVDGKVVSQSTGESNRAKANAWLKEFERQRRAMTAVIPKDQRTFGQAARAYLRFRGIDLDHAEGPAQRAEIRRIRRLLDVLDTRLIVELSSADLHQAAQQIYPAGQPSTLNREALRPAAAILHYASDNGWCPHLRIKLFAEKPPKTRALAAELDDALLAGIPAGKRSTSRRGSDPVLRRLVVLWFLRQGTRVSDTLRITWDDIKLDRETFSLFVSKTKTWHDFALDPEIVEALQAIPLADRTGPVFPWKQKTGVYKWLRPLTRELKIAFTPHMGRHSVGKRMNDAGLGLRTIMETLGHADHKSSLRYQAGDIEVVRAGLRTLAAKRKAARA
jgi:integrase